MEFLFCIIYSLKILLLFVIFTVKKRDKTHDFVITIISNRYIKSRNCMYEVLEVIWVRNFGNKLIYSILKEEDKKYYKVQCPNIVGADVYSTVGPTKYSLFCKQKTEELQELYWWLMTKDWSFYTELKVWDIETYDLLSNPIIMTS